MSSNENLKDIQRSLKTMGHDPGPIDGLWGRRTKAGIQSLIEFSGQPLIQSTVALPQLPWISEAMTVYGLHETADNEELSIYLRSDGAFLGDPDEMPWCGDLADTVIHHALPDEKYKGKLKQNPYWARNWKFFGRACPAVFGAIASFTRGDGGHVGFLVGESGSYYDVLGGNQGNSVSVVRILKKRLIATRWPITYPLITVPLPTKVALGKLVVRNTEVSHNEA